ncbi:hypothetical protein AB0J72_22830 [Dactylosporangium sp. NPDC049742]|uniref:hypothetical protein n=1 Tax=Dactylosporangium sp. NPDC049742 TaxID=3154737 RepID=UPI00343775DD
MGSFSQRCGVGVLAVSGGPDVGLERDRRTFPFALRAEDSRTRCTATVAVTPAIQRLPCQPAETDECAPGQLFKVDHGRSWFGDLGQTGRWQQFQRKFVTLAGIAAFVGEIRGFTHIGTSERRAASIRLHQT